LDRWQSSDDRWRTAPHEAILGNDTFWTKVLNPYCVRPRSRISGERPGYLVAVCAEPIRDAKTPSREDLTPATQVKGLHG
jgi:hypothetical protein